MFYPDYSAVHKKQVVPESDFLHRFPDAHTFNCRTAGLRCISFKKGKFNRSVYTYKSANPTAVLQVPTSMSLSSAAMLCPNLYET